MKNKELIIVESPTKALTIKHILKGKFEVLSSRGHIKDLPKSRLGIDIENSFEPHFIIIRGKSKIVKELNQAAREAKTIYLGCDPDREGEAIAYHIAQEINHNRPIKRVLFYEITKKGIKEALANPTEIDLKKVDSHKARRVLDRLVGYLVSPLLWKIFKKRNLSAGRVQTVALRIICEREKAIEEFIPEAYWLIYADFLSARRDEFRCILKKINGKEERVKDERMVKEIEEEIHATQNFKVSALKETEKHIKPQPPFITSTLQQTAAQKLGFSAKKTMFLAQRLFEGVDLEKERVGLITYPRTDSFRIADEFLEITRNWIREMWGSEYLPPGLRVYKEKKFTQGAHEAIRPTDLKKTPESVKAFLSEDEFKLYELIYRRFIASQMSDACYKIMEVEIEGGRFLFYAVGRTRKFSGFEIIYPSEERERILPPLKKDEVVYLKEVIKEQNFTKPPPRYTEATLIKKLEQHGIGRPSTYAVIVQTLFERNYVEKRSGQLVPTELGRLVTNILIPKFSDIFTIPFTRNMERDLDEIEEGKKNWVAVAQKFHSPFQADLAKFELEIAKIQKELFKPTNEFCPQCGKSLTIRWGPFGKYVGCANYPECPYIKKDINYLTELCPRCGKNLIERTSRFGKFVACSGYPECRFIKKDEPKLLPETCPRCSKPLVERRMRSKKFAGCSGYPDCKYTKRLK